jgi:hypothetical protein
MAQITTRQVTTLNHPLALATFTLIPGLILEALTGAGWLNIRLHATISSNFNGINTAYLTLEIDGQIFGADHPAYGFHTIPQTNYVQMTIDYFVRLGAGQHKIQAFGKADSATATIYSRQLYLSLNEPGF